MSAPILETERLRLRPLAPADAEAVQALFAESAVRRYLLDGEVMSRDWIDGMIEQSATDFAERGCGLWLVERDDSLAGVVGYRDFFEPPVFEIIWIVSSALHGQGIAVEAARAALAHGFEALSTDAIPASIDGPNTASIRVAGKLGFEETGRDPGAFGETIHYRLRRERFARRVSAP